METGEGPAGDQGNLVGPSSPHLEVVVGRPESIDCQMCGEKVPVKRTGILPRFCGPCRLKREGGYAPRKLPTQTEVAQTLALRAAEFRLRHEAATALLVKAYRMKDWALVKKAYAELADIVDIREHTAHWG